MRSRSRTWTCPVHQPSETPSSAGAEFGLYGYTDLPADHAEVVASWLGRVLGAEFEPGHILYANRVVQVFATALRTLTEPGGRVALFTPSYSPLEVTITENGRDTVRLPLLLQDGRYVLDRELVERTLPSVKILLLVNPHNPVGKAWSGAELEWLAAACERHGVLIVSDEVHAAFYWGERSHRFIGELVPRSITFTSPAKTFNLPGLEITHVIIPDDELRATIGQAQHAAGFHNPSYMAHSATVAAYDGSSDAWLEETKRTITANLADLRAAVAGWDSISLIEPQATFLAWLDARAVGDERVLREWFVDRARVYPSFGTDFGPEYDGFLRLNLATPQELFTTALDRLQHTKEGNPLS